jgi:hypothetical protein
MQMELLSGGLAGVFTWLQVYPTNEMSLSFMDIKCSSQGEGGTLTGASIFYTKPVDLQALNVCVLCGLERGLSFLAGAQPAV